MTANQSIVDRISGRKKGKTYAGPTVFRSNEERSIKTKKRSNQLIPDRPVGPCPRNVCDKACEQRQYDVCGQTDDCSHCECKKCYDRENGGDSR